MKTVYALQTSDTDDRFEEGLAHALDIYEDRETAQAAADVYNADFNDDVPAFVVELNFFPTVKDIALTEAVKA